MGFIKRHKGRANYDLLSNYSHYLPGFGGMMMMLFLFGIGAVIGILVLLPFTLMYPESAMTYGNIISYPLMFVPPMIYASVQSRRANIFESGYALDSNNFGGRKGWNMALIVSAMALAGAFVIEPVSMLLPEMSETMKAAMDMILDGPVWIVLISVSVFAPFFEEWLCRGIILRGLLTRVKPAWAIVISAAVFGLIHGNLWQAIPAFIIGVILGYVYYKTGSLKLTMLMHCANNTMAAVFSRIPALEEAKSFIDVMNPWTYAGIFICSAAFVVAAIIVFAGIPHKEGNLGGCDKA